MTVAQKDLAGRPTWSTPVLIEEEIADLTQNTANRPGDDGLDNSPGDTAYYMATGNS